MRVLVTGSRGFLGKHLVERLAREGHQAVAFLREEVRSAEALRDLLKSGFDGVCHLGAFIPKNHADPACARDCLEGNALFTLDLLAACAAAPEPPRFVYYSAGNAYPVNAAAPALETESLDPSRHATYYLGSKVLGENWVEHFRIARQLRSFSLRITTPYGRGMPDGSVVARFVSQARAGTPLEVRDPTYQVDLVYVDDVVAATLAALRSDAPGIYNVASGASTSLLTLAQTVVANLESASRIDAAPPLEGLRGFRPVSIDKARSRWEFCPRSLNEGVRSLIEGH